MFLLEGEFGRKIDFKEGAVPTESVVGAQFEFCGVSFLPIDEGAGDPLICGGGIALEGDGWVANLGCSNIRGVDVVIGK